MTMMIVYISFSHLSVLSSMTQNIHTPCLYVRYSSTKLLYNRWVQVYCLIFCEFGVFEYCLVSFITCMHLSYITKQRQQSESHHHLTPSNVTSKLTTLPRHSMVSNSPASLNYQFFYTTPVSE